MFDYSLVSCKLQIGYLHKTKIVMHKEEAQQYGGLIAIGILRLIVQRYHNYLAIKEMPVERESKMICTMVCFCYDVI